jgi:hypothetical protein
MKRQIIFNLDEEVVEWLKGMTNRSSYLNDILLKRMEKEIPEQMSIEEIKKQIKLAKLKEEYEAKMREVENESE